MVPTLENGEQLIVEKMSRYFGLPSYTEIITFRHPDESRKDSHLVKRVIGLPGDHIEIRDGKVYRNGIQVDEPYLGSGVVTSGADRGFDDVVVAEGEIYVLGDNRSVSSDSRFFGPIKMNLVEGHVLIRIWPLTHFRWFR